MKRTCGYRGRRHAVPLGLLLAALCALLALAFLFFYTPMRFSGCLLLCAAVYFVLWHFLWLRREHRLARAVLVILAALLIGGLAVFTVLEAQIIGYGRTDRESPVSAVVVLGAGVFRIGLRCPLWSLDPKDRERIFPRAAAWRTG